MGHRSLRSRKVVLLAGAASLAVLAAACSSSGSNSSSSSSSGSSSGKITIAFNMGAEADPFFIAMNLGTKTAATKYGVTLIGQGDPSVYSPSTQIPIAQQLLAQDPSGFIIAPTDPLALQRFLSGRRDRRRTI
jgi:ribose transport system substrate-binding protein